MLNYFCILLPLFWPLIESLAYRSKMQIFFAVIDFFKTFSTLILIARLLRKVVFLTHCKDKSREEKKILCRMSQTVTIWRNMNFAHYFGCESGTYPRSQTLIKIEEQKQGGSIKTCIFLKICILKPIKNCLETQWIINNKDRQLWSATNKIRVESHHIWWPSETRVEEICNCQLWG